MKKSKNALVQRGEETREERILDIKLELKLLQHRLNILDVLIEYADDNSDSDDGKAFRFLEKRACDLMNKSLELQQEKDSLEDYGLSEFEDERLDLQSDF